MARRIGGVFALVLSLLIGLPAAAHACGGLVAGKHAEVLRRATTLAAWFDGVEHYVTGFEFAGTADTFGYIIPLPAPPSEVRKGGDWMLERLEREAFPQPPQDVALLALREAAGSAASPVEVLKAVKIDSLDIRVVRGGASDVVRWANEHGFLMTPDTDELLAKYPAKIFALAKFEKADASRKFVQGQGVVIDFEIPLPGPWIPLQILSLGKLRAEVVEAHLFMLTPERPALYPDPDTLEGVRIAHSAPANRGLISDLRSDSGTRWVPDKAWFTAIELSAPAPTVRYDLAAVSGGIKPAIVSGRPDPRDGSPVGRILDPNDDPWTWWLIAAAVLAVVTGMLRRRMIKERTEA
ncbi:MAG: DUF2330 domain-containing protein [Actinomycetota bacterium]